MTNEGGSGGVGGSGCGLWLQRWRVSILLMQAGVTVYLFLLPPKFAKEPKYPCFIFGCWLLQAQVCNKKWVALWDWVRGLQWLTLWPFLFYFRWDPKLFYLPQLLLDYCPCKIFLESFVYFFFIVAGTKRNW